MAKPSTSVHRSKARLRELVDVRSRPTVVRLEHLDQEDHDWITEAYHLTDDVSQHLGSLRACLARDQGCGIFLIGQYGSGKSHFLAYLLEKIRAGDLAEKGPGREAVAVSLLNFRGSVPLEDIVRTTLGLAGSGHDRRDEWSSLARRYPNGVVLLVDELSEFLQSKPDARSYNEDVRFLQFMGEWSGGCPFWILAAMQEEIEHTGDLEYGIYRKIKDRFPLRFLLTPSHVRDLISESILVKNQGYHQATAELIVELKRAFPNSSVDYDQLAAIYPLHPATLEVLEEVRDRFSQARGIVDFTVTRLGGNRSRGVEPFLDQPWGGLVTPDAVFDHFEDLFELQPPFQPISQQLLPYYRKHLGRIFSKPPLELLAWRILKLLVLAHLSSSRRGLSAAEVVDWLQYRVTRLDPNKNVQVVQRTLQQLTDQGRYVATVDGVTTLRLDDDGGAALEQFLQRRRAELSGQGVQILEHLASLLPGESFGPFDLNHDTWQQREVRWHFHQRAYALYVGSGTPSHCKGPNREGMTLIVRLPWEDASPAIGHNTLLPAPIEVGEDHIDLAALWSACQRTWDRAITEKLERRFQQRFRLFETQVRNAYLEARFTAPSGQPESLPRIDPADAFIRWLERVVTWMFKRAFPSFELFAPTHGPLPKEAFRALMRFVSEHDLGDATDDKYVQLIREAYLVPMKLLRRQGRGYQFQKNPEQNELVRSLLSMVDCQPTPASVAAHLAGPVYGLVPDQISLLLVVLVILGEIDLVKDRKSYRDHYETLPLPIQYDRIIPGIALGVEQLRQLEELCNQLSVRSPEQWTVLAQRKIARTLRQLSQSRCQPLETLRLKLRELGQADALCDKIQKHLSQWAALEQGGDPLDGLRQFLYEIDEQFSRTLLELERLPAVIDRLLGEIQRLTSLLTHPVVAEGQDGIMVERIDALGPAPTFDQTEQVETWLQSARTLYDEYRQAYERNHQKWWKQSASHPLWEWQPDPLARGRHLDLGKELGELETCRLQAEKCRCTGLVSLEFQPVCHCRFDGGSSPIQEQFERFDRLRHSIETTLGHFFAQQAVRDRLRKWADDGLEVTPRTDAYLQGKSPYPEVNDLHLLDDYLSGAELVSEVDPSAIWRLLEKRTWDRSGLVTAIDELLAGYGAVRFRFGKTGSAKARSDPERSLVRWCLERGLRDGVPLPRGLPADLLEEAADAIRPEWVSAESLERFEKLAIGEAATSRILAWVVDGLVDLPDRFALVFSEERSEEMPGQRAEPKRLDAELANGSCRPRGRPGSRVGTLSPAVFSAGELCKPTKVETPGELASFSKLLYLGHEPLMRIAGSRWLRRIEQVARIRLVPEVEDLAAVLGRQADCQWVIVDCLGLPLLEMLHAELESLLPAWRFEQEEFAQVSARTTTDAFYRDLLQAGFQRTLEKTNVVDRILHDRFLPLSDFSRLAAAELRIAFRSIGKRLDKKVPLLVFADHGFRIASDGRSYVHGGDSTLERVVPVVRLKPV